MACISASFMAWQPNRHTNTHDWTWTELDTGILDWTVLYWTVCVFIREVGNRIIIIIIIVIVVLLYWVLCAFPRCLALPCLAFPYSQMPIAPIIPHSTGWLASWPNPPQPPCSCIWASGRTKDRPASYTHNWIIHWRILFFVIFLSLYSATGWLASSTG